MNDFSLFDGDPLNRLFLRIGVGSRGFVSCAARFSVLMLLTCLPTVILAKIQGFDHSKPRALDFFSDFAAFAQAFIGYPLFIYAERTIGKKTRSAAHHFMDSGVVLDQDKPTLGKLHEKIHSLRKLVGPDLICLALGFIFGVCWLYEEAHNSYDTWHAIGAPGVQTPTYAGWWVALIGIPIFNYWWLRWIWKVSIWCWYLFKVSKLDLRLIAAHPDLTGGLSFLSEAQKSFAVVIFAFGLGIIAPLIGFKIEVEHASFFSFAVMGPLIGFILGAPSFFTLPLLMFTKRLSRTKKRAVDAYQDRATSAALYFEKKWLNACPVNDEECELLLGTYLQGMKNLNLGFEHIKKMRVVPFDTKSFTQMIGSTFGSLLPLATQYGNLPHHWIQAMEILKSLGGH